MREECYDVFLEQNRRMGYGGKKRYNYELYEMFNDSDIVVHIKVKHRQGT